MKSTVRFAYDLCSFISVYLFALTYAINLNSADYKIHWNLLVLYDKRKMVSNLNMSYRKMSDFVSFPLFGFTLVIKLRNFDFESNSN